MDNFLNTASKEKWQCIGTQKRAGILVPLFSVYSRDSIGIGDFSDLRLIVDWASQTGNSIVQLLPMNELGSVFCPYDSVSSFALEPAYISLQLLPQAEQSSIKERIGIIKKILPAGKGNVNYAVKKEKISLLWDIFLSDGSAGSVNFKKFKSDNAYWLMDFALYKVFKDYHDGKAWFDWQDSCKYRHNAEIEDFCLTHEKEINFQFWLQWQLYQQFSEVKKYANAKNVFLKGDLPILVSRDSADVWAHPEFFKLDFAAGAPPDMYCAKGQRWGMPTYDWEKIASSGYKYLKEKLRYAENFYDVLRIDHVVGLFRIWSIPYNEPAENQGLHGSFDPRDEHLWAGHGRNLLQVINQDTKMLLCAEDLGIIPRSCTDTLKEMCIPGNDVQRWVKDWNLRHDFLSPNEYRELSVAMLSTHDTTNWPAWWENEAGTVDEALFVRKCYERKIDFDAVKQVLFNPGFSRNGRLRWRNEITSAETLVSVLGKRKEEIGDFFELYLNTYQEKEKLWKLMGLAGPMREACDKEIVRAALKITLGSSAIFCIELITDWLMLEGAFTGDAYQYRINTPGTVSSNNWSLTIPLPLEDLLKHPVNQQIKEMVASAGRI